MRAEYVPNMTPLRSSLGGGGWGPGVFAYLSCTKNTIAKMKKKQDLINMLLKLDSDTKKLIFLVVKIVLGVL